MNARLEQSKAPSSGDFPLLSEIDQTFREALKKNAFSGASLLIGTPDRLLLQKFWGFTKSGGIPVDIETRFDLASLTKPLVTTALCLWSISERIFGLEDPIAEFFLSGAVPPDKQAITIRHLLGHCSGLPPYQPYYRDLIQVPGARRRSELLQWILQSRLVAPPGIESHYSDLGFMVLGMILEEVLNDRLDQLAGRILLEPLASDRLEFVPLQPLLDPALSQETTNTNPLIFAATEDCPWRKRILQGEVHDENAYCLEGVAGHAGLFGTAMGVYSLLSYLWKVYLGRLAKALFSQQVLRTFWTRQDLIPTSSWGLGFDTPCSAQSSAGSYFSPHSVGHLGFTGTSFWMDLEQEVMVVLLTNRVYPTRANERIKEFRPRIHNLAMKAFHEFSK